MAIIGGGGIAGLSAAFYASKKGICKNKILICEATDRVGGWMRTYNHKECTFEAGPRTIRPQGPSGANTLQLVEELGLGSLVKPIKSDQPAAQNRMVYAKGALNTLPSSFMSLFKVKKPFTQSLATTLWKEYRTKPGEQKNDESLHDFMERRFGKEFAEYLIGPLVCGICAGDARQLSVKFLSEKLFKLEQTYGSVVKGILKGALKNTDPMAASLLRERANAEKWTMYSFEGGIETLPQHLLENVVKAGAVHCPDHCVEKVNFYKDNQRVRIKFKGGASYSSDYFLSALPAYSLAPAIQDEHPNLAKELDDIPFVDVAVLNLFYKDKGLKLNAFGFLVPPIERRPILGVLFDSCCFPNENGSVLTVMMGGKWFEEYFGKNPDKNQLLEIAKTQLKEILRMDYEPDEHIVHIHRKCIPQYLVGHNDRVERIRKYIKDNNLPMSVCGSSYDGVGLNDVILSAKNAVDEIKIRG